MRVFFLICGTVCYHSSVYLFQSLSLYLSWHFEGSGRRKLELSCGKRAHFALSAAPAPGMRLNASLAISMLLNAS